MARLWAAATASHQAVIFAFGGCALFASSYYCVQRTSGVGLFLPRLASFTFWGWQLVILLAAVTFPLDLPIEWGWDEVTITNLKKIDAELGTVLRDDHGKIMKPPGWRPPNMLRIIQEFDKQK